MKEKINIFWFRRDLRLDDNIGFNEVQKSGLKILPIFIYDPEILDELPKEDARLTFIHSLLTNINDELEIFKTSLATFKDKPSNIFEQLIKSLDVQSVYTNHDYEPYAIQRDSDIKNLLEKNGVQLKTFKDQVIFERDEIVKEDGSPYVVFTPYANKWKSKLNLIQIQTVGINIDSSDFILHKFPFLRLEEIGFNRSTIQPKQLDLSSQTLNNYADDRDFPAKESTTHLSSYLRFGAVSIRSIFAQAFQLNIKKLVDELIWREFFMQILWHFPHTVTKSFKPKYDDIVWRNNEEEFNKWCEGNTGYPMVDAGMRELNATGNMHNRVRMVVAGFLCKHLLIDWRWGEAYFAEKLLDYEQSSNIGNWQWAAGSGVDAAPYFRIFNPTEQVKKFDKDLKYIKKWVPEVEEFSYSTPIVDHKDARERCLTTYKIALD